MYAEDTTIVVAIAQMKNHGKRCGSESESEKERERTRG
jgi:hypothetical protein